MSNFLSRMHSLLYSILCKLPRQEGLQHSASVYQAGQKKVLRGLKAKPKKAKKERTTCEDYCEPEEPKAAAKGKGVVKGKKVTPAAKPAKKSGKGPVDQVGEAA